MFTGIVEELGTVKSIRREGRGARVEVASRLVTDGITTGSSLCVSGVCITVTEANRGGFAFDLVEETLDRSTFRYLEAGQKVNLERSLRLSDRLGGHLVAGHVDGVARIIRRIEEERGSERRARMVFGAEPALAEAMVEKGSVSLDGVSLTVFDIRHEEFTVALIPFTLSTTTLGLKVEGDLVNVETDLLGKYVRKFLSAHSSQTKTLREEDLRSYGY